MKLLLRRFMLLDSFCKHCGRRVHDFLVSDVVWQQVEPYIHSGHVLCYDCFCDVCAKAGLPTVWLLEALPWQNRKIDLTSPKHMV
jgi:hypothetical protein